MGQPFVPGTPIPTQLGDREDSFTKAKIQARGVGADTWVLASSFLSPLAPPISPKARSALGEHPSVLRHLLVRVEMLLKPYL